MQGPVHRYELPGIHAINFVCERALGGGGMASLRNDPLGKGMAQMLLDMPVEVPARPAAGGDGMNFDFSDDQLAIRDAVEAICADFGADYWLERDRDGRWPERVLRGRRRAAAGSASPCPRSMAAPASASRRPRW